MIPAFIFAALDPCTAVRVLRSAVPHAHKAQRPKAQRTLVRVVCLFLSSIWSVPLEKTAEEPAIWTNSSEICFLALGRKQFSAVFISCKHPEVAFAVKAVASGRVQELWTECIVQGVLVWCLHRCFNNGSKPESSQKSTEREKADYFSPVNLLYSVAKQINVSFLHCQWLNCLKWKTVKYWVRLLLSRKDSHEGVGQTNVCVLQGRSPLVLTVV